MKDKSIKSTMKSWIMLSEKELDDTQVYMQEQEQQDQQEKDNSFSEAESGSSNVGSAKYESQVSDTGTETFSDAENGFERKLSREEQVDQLIKEAGEEVVDPEVDSVPRKRRKRHRNKKGKFEKGEARESIESEERFVSESMNESMSDTTREKESMASEVENAAELTKDNGNKSDKSSGISKMLVGGVGVLLVLIIAGLGYQTQSLQKQNQKLKTEISTLKKEKKQAEQASEEQALQTKNEDGVVENTDKMFASVGVGDKEYKLLAKVSDFTKDGWKLEALRNENATLVPGGKLEKDAFLTNKDGRKIGVIIRNLSDKNQKVSDCIVTKLSFSKEMFDGQITLPGSLGFDSTEKELKAAGFKKDADGIYTYTSKKIKDDTIKAAMADGESVSEITLERAVDESSTSTGNAAANTSVSTAAGSATTTASDSSSAEQNSATADTTLTNNSNSASDAAEEQKVKKQQNNMQ